MAAPEQSGIKIIIVGAGFAGLACAIECKRKGHDPVILEKFSELKPLGDVISFGHNAGRIIERWGLHDKFWPVCTQHETLHLHNYQGKKLVAQHLPHTDYGGVHSYNGHRGELHKIVYDHALALGVPIRLGCRVTEYWETPDAAGVVCNGERLTADLVIGADGVRSKARQLVLGYDDKPKSSGYAVYRAWCFNTKELGIDKDPLTSFLVDSGDAFYGWIGRDVHMLASSSRGGDALSVVMTHKDDADIEESWSFPGKMEDVLKVVDGWDPRCAAIWKKTPSCVDWKLVYRDPLPTWISKDARLALIGDAAHPFLPTSIQGASQALEDGLTLAITLQLAGKGDVPLAVRAWEKIRYQRVRRAQLLGETTRDKWHHSRDDADADEVLLDRPEWLLGFDAEAHAYAAAPAVLEEIRREGYTLPVLPDL